MIPPRLARLCILPALFSAAALAGQAAAPGAAGSSSPACDGGPADEGGMRIAFTLPGTPERAAGWVDQALRATEYAVAQPPRGAGAWAAEPRAGWPAEYAGAPWHGPAHPGVRLSGNIQPRGDSVEVTLFARTLCRATAAAAAAQAGAAEDLLERFSALDLMYEVVKQSGQRFAPLTLGMPTELGEFQLDRNRTRGALMHYRSTDGTLLMQVRITMDRVPYARCAPSCAEVEVQKAVAGHFQEIAGVGIPFRYRATEPLAPAAGDRWLAGRHVTHEAVVANQPRVFHEYVYMFPNHLVQFRGLVADTPRDAERVRAFVVAALGFQGRDSPFEPPR